MSDDRIDDGSERPLGYETEDGELRVAEIDGERCYQETELGQHRRWMRQASDLFAEYQRVCEKLRALEEQSATPVAEERNE